MQVCKIGFQFVNGLIANHNVMRIVQESVSSVGVDGRLHVPVHLDVRESLRE